MTDVTNTMKNWVIAMYGLFAVGLVIPALPLLGLVLALVKRKDAAGTVYESHCQWIIYTFLYAFLASIVLALLIGMEGAMSPARLIVCAWVFYRLVRGGLLLRDGKPATNPKAFI